MIEITVLFFATLKDLVGQKQTIIQLPAGSTIIDLKALLSNQFPSLSPALPSALVSMNREYSLDTDIIVDRSEIALFPPVSGGTETPTVVSITTDTLDLDSLVAQITLPSSGAVAIFTGMVRGETIRQQAHQTVYLEYEAYKPMAESKLHQVAGEIRQRWPDVEGIAIVQRIGRLYPGTPTVIIACTAAHRDTGVFEAARYGIDRLKEIVPVWKKEVGPQGEMWVEGEYIPQPGKD
jgi:molybdopterin synthase catalytic subunit